MPKATIIGLGRSGIAAARVLKGDNWEVTLSDRSNSPNLQQTQGQLQQEGITVKLGDSFTLNPEDLPNLIVVSPGVPWDIPVLVEARDQGIDTIGELELAWRYLNGCSWVGITGTNGKTTTTALIAAIFKAAGLNAPACGNIGYAACELALTQQSYDWIIAEISSYQIESSATLSPKIGIWTTFTPDHLERHKTLDNYYQIKASLLSRCRRQIFNGDDPYLHNIGLSQWKDSYWTSVKGKEALLCDPSKGIYLQDNWIVAFGELIAPINLFKMVGEHNQQNLLMAVGAARLADINKDAIAEAMATFSGVPHRLELIRTIAGVDYINDSKATNYDAAQVGLSSVEAPVILIAGGQAKKGDDTEWIKLIKAKVATVLLIGEAASTFAQRLQESDYYAYEIVETMENAVERSASLATDKGVKIVLLSPACASFDQYQSFEHRGDHFRELCLQL
ncbi:UDP-N-acetylmuramoylalanine/D-glutamate ligase [Gloeothece citriformis PCC 7424]|uniref:UDP-N-acetylmuramoylalanine--D-glutamate ligase n=1 Tax=Gloeothece citriformis (strain PCC 7424) TaxID=65393 RepID=MURD_GLOC7|nr:UDP-N-acetylmuramoyl-L-alanine--D-glutamate ligase [Gloeothece citriformis]B7KH28.1 RecName: Full=UDP-N-acetylmuramoylalanine--D-glutamate ligase; AltName: Full=D-glutamic acid-adding enzyme; AltName: Full=UDP-N-acetylmuramoyl-L-alanyl-D-glutamate synthetase [Gloeothece citriformis PCC 7424]ACK73515.1 UDP-N-acetylmuramoylalanine/D-glutamate ligase [Gloeothece citriformis PCC 7424]